ncbi:6797_t:CDS:1, partial [Paraglomus occultum]
MSDPSNVKLIFESPDGTAIKVKGEGKDEKGAYTIVNGSYDSVLKTIPSSTKAIPMRSGTIKADVITILWEVDIDDKFSTGYFFIRRTSVVENQFRIMDWMRNQSEGMWRGFYFDANNNVYMIISGKDQNTPGSGADVR